MRENLCAYLAGNEYPGRGICIGKTPSGNRAVIAYFIMGRSVNSRNRVFDAIDGGIRTVAADPSKMTDPHLIIYNPVLIYGDTTIVTNGDQTDTILDFLARGEFPGFGFEAALNTRTFEDDGPNWTPRISGIVDMRTGAYKFSILKSCEGNEKSIQRFTFDYPEPLAGDGHFISTYKCNGAPIPSFVGEPLRVAVDEEGPKEYAHKLWEALNEENKVSLFVRTIDLKTQAYEDVIINKYEIAKG
ncbi:MAG: IMP cyclohydrolase [Smithellaceae bacterium]|nr:IMP cyclohydrolase [Smithellaceae bacterium]